MSTKRAPKNQTKAAIVETAVAPSVETPETPNADETVAAPDPADTTGIDADVVEAANGLHNTDPAPAPKELPTLLAPQLAEDGLSVKMPEGHTVHLETPIAAVDPNVRSTAAGVILTSEDDQRKIDEA